MKKRTFNIIILALMSGVLLLLNTRCVKLEETPRDFVGPDNFYQSTSQIEATFSSAMNRLYNSWSTYGSFYTRFIHDDELGGGSLVIADDYESNLWRQHYKSIADINPAIKALNNNVLAGSVTQAVKDQLMAQARFIRAFNYFCLVRLWGDVPLIKETTSPVMDPISRAPVSEIYAFIESDLLFAAANLPVSWPASQRGRPTMDVAKGFLAKMYITMATNPLNDASKYVKARDMAKEVMDAGNYRLVDSINKVFALENLHGPEMMWAFNVTRDDGPTEPQIWLPESMAGGWGDIKVDKAWGEAYPDQPRKQAYLILEDWDGKPYTTFWWQTPAIRKFVYNPRADLEAYKSDQNFPLLRYADILMLFAEAENMVNNGPNTAACAAVNQIIDRANGYVPDTADPPLTTSMSKAAFDAAVIHQRSLELCFELNRWYDLIRKRILYEMSIPLIRVNFSEDDYLYPIPLNDLRLNPLMVQNPGYTTPPRN